MNYGKSVTMSVIWRLSGLQIQTLSVWELITVTDVDTDSTEIPTLMFSNWICKHFATNGIVLGNLEQATPEGFRNLSRFARSGCGGRSETDRCRSAPPPDHRSRCGLEGRSPPRSYVPNSAPIRASKRRPDQRTTKFVLLIAEFLAIPGPRFWESCGLRFAMLCH